MTPRATVDRQVAALARQLPPGGVSVAALNTKTGASYHYGATGGMWTGSVVKLLILEALLLQHQDAGTQLSNYEMSQAVPMIENSDNAAEYQLFLQIGGDAALADAARRLGLTHTVQGVSDPAFTTMSASDGLALVRNLVGKGPLNQYSRGVALSLMRQVEPDQRWGVSAVADPGSTQALKNGWLSVDDTNGAGEDDDDRWLVNSVGIVTVHGQQVLLAVFTQHGESFGDGVQLTEALTKAMTPAVVAH